MKNLVIWGGLSWLVPFIVSIFLVDPVTKAYLPNIRVFKAIMIICLLVIIFVSSKKIVQPRYVAAHTFLIINILCDLVVLIGVLGVTPTDWMTTVLPIYIVCLYGGFYVLSPHKHA